jgi:hypothetical protein
VAKFRLPQFVQLECVLDQDTKTAAIFFGKTKIGNAQWLSCVTAQYRFE